METCYQTCWLASAYHHDYLLKFYHGGLQLHLESKLQQRTVDQKDLSVAFLAKMTCVR